MIRALHLLDWDTCILLQIIVKWSEYISIQSKLNFKTDAIILFVGNDIMHMMTSNEEQELRVDIGDYKGNVFFAHYNKFSVGSEADHYKLMVEGYNGDAGKFI